MNLYVGKISYKNRFFNRTEQRKCTYSNIAPLSHDTVSFGAMKKNQFEGIDLLIVNKFKAPIEKFNANEDFQSWCGQQIEELKKTNLKARKEETAIQRKATFKEWCDYVLDENDAYTNSISLLILNGILQDIEKSNDTEIPPLNKGVLASVIDNISKKLEGNPKAQVNFSKEYRIGLQNVSLDNLNTKLDGDKTGWVIIPSKTNDPEHFEENVDKLKTLSHKNWCTASFNAKPYLSNGDFHVYLENGKPKLGVRFVGDKIQEIQGPKNNGKIPIKYLNEAKSHTSEFKKSTDTQNEFKQAEKVKEKVDRIKSKLKSQGVDFKTASAEQIFDALEITYEKDRDGLLILDKYDQTDEDFTFEDVGVNENKLFKSIKEIKRGANFTESEITDLGSLRSIGGNAYFMKSQVADLGSLRSIGGNAYFMKSQVADLGSLRNIGGNADFVESQVADLGSLRNIGGNANFKDSNVTDLSALRSIGGDAYFGYSKVTDLSALQNIGGDAYFGYSKVTNINSLQNIGGNVDLRDSKLTQEDFEKKGIKVKKFTY